MAQKNVTQRVSRLGLLRKQVQVFFELRYMLGLILRAPIRVKYILLAKVGIGLGGFSGTKKAFKV